MSALWSAVHYSRPCSLSLQSARLQSLHPIDSHARERPSGPPGSGPALNDRPHTYNLQSPTLAPAAAVCPIHLSLAGWVNEEQLTAPAGEHGHGGDSDAAHPSAVSTIASAHCAQRVSLPSAELKLMIPGMLTRPEVSRPRPRMRK